ncbi:uncharacterized protein BDR25DRAFT_353235 [Lindgomyces ingoldianus]|uniref:Uncharacterized protein n=1 Tax=Lindgomyces ingoldianus TaxID=673940 RepID=A0ACB6R3M6_9PLEO|nr:uncharacterized protein BDR25DRAFT_353235 [Lindgomyces ingoldianus]KAF2472927.1 hypothetical protein BDR25DRAFT_353235 [Lindgomyces ingoldianus]
MLENRSCSLWSCDVRRVVVSSGGSLRYDGEMNDPRARRRTASLLQSLSLINDALAPVSNSTSSPCPIMHAQILQLNRTAGSRISRTRELGTPIVYTSSPQQAIMCHFSFQGYCAKATQFHSFKMLRGFSISVYALVVLFASLYQLLLNKVLFVSFGIGRLIQPIEDFPYSCGRIEYEKLKTCEDL